MHTPYSPPTVTRIMPAADVRRGDVLSMGDDLATVTEVRTTATPGYLRIVAHDRAGWIIILRCATTWRMAVTRGQWT